VDILSDQEREFAEEVANFAMMASWDKSIQTHARKSGMSEGQVILILNKAAKFNDSADPKGRIDALNDWERHKANPHKTLPAKGQGKSVM
jgi:hypothetical protein